MGERDRMANDDILVLARYLVAKILASHEDEPPIEWKDVPGLGEDEWEDVYAMTQLTFAGLASRLFEQAGARGAELFRKTAE